MRNIRRILLTALAALSGVSAFGQWKLPDLTTGGPFYHTEQVCNFGDGYFHDVTYVYYKFAGFSGPYTFSSDRRSMPPEKCVCIAMGGSGGGGAFTDQVAHEQAGEDNCHSSGPNGQPGTYDGSAAPVSQAGSTSGVTNSLKRRSRAAVLPGSTAFIYTVPFRALPASPAVPVDPPVTSQTCNAGLSPTMFETAHVSDTVNRYDLCTGALIATINVAPLPLQVRVTPDGSQAIVTNYQSAITFIDTNTNTVSATIQTDPSFTPSGIAISSDGTYALVTNYEPPPDAYLAVLDIATQTITRTIPLDIEYPQSVYINPDGTLAWVTHPWDNTVEVIDIMTGTPVYSIAFDTPYSVAFNPTGTVAYVAGGESIGSVSVYDTSTYSMVATIPAGPGACDLRVSLDGTLVFANNAFAPSVTVIDTRSFTGVTFTTQGPLRGAVLVPTQ